MRNLLAWLAVVVLIFIGAGWYLAWFRVKSVQTEPGHHNLSIDLEDKKIREDIKKREQKLDQILDNDDKKDTAPRSKSSDPPIPPGNVSSPAVPSPTDTPGAPSKKN